VEEELRLAIRVYEIEGTTEAYFKVLRSRCKIGDHSWGMYRNKQLVDGIIAVSQICLVCPAKYVKLYKLGPLVEDMPGVSRRGHIDVTEVVF